MGVVRIDDDLQKKLLNEMKKGRNKYSYGSISSFLNSIIYDKLLEMEKEDEKNRK